jgi:hypothetical protein
VTVSLSAEFVRVRRYADAIALVEPPRKTPASLMTGVPNPAGYHFSSAVRLRVLGSTKQVSHNRPHWSERIELVRCEVG